MHMQRCADVQEGVWQRSYGRCFEFFHPLQYNVIHAGQACIEDSSILPFMQKPINNSSTSLPAEVIVEILDNANEVIQVLRLGMILHLDLLSFVKDLQVFWGQNY
jgi:hypothetical protein